jgi:hypothetical protein
MVGDFDQTTQMNVIAHMLLPYLVGSVVEPAERLSVILPQPVD